MNPSKIAVAAPRVTELKQQYPLELDVPRFLSYGAGGAKSMLGALRTTLAASITITNATLSAKTIVLGTSVNSMFASNAALAAALGADFVISDGILLDETGGKVLSVRSNDPDRPVDNWMRHVARTPTVFARMRFISQTTGGAADTSNYGNSIQTSFVSPYRKSEDEYIHLRDSQNNAATSPQFGEIDFQNRSEIAQVSNENFIVFTVNSLTSMTINFDVLSEKSEAQYSYRVAKGAKKVLGML